MLPKSICIAISFFFVLTQVFFFSSCLCFENRLMKGNIFFSHGCFYQHNVGGRRRTFLLFSSSVFKRKYFTFNLTMNIELILAVYLYLL